MKLYFGTFVNVQPSRYKSDSYGFYVSASNRQDAEKLSIEKFLSEHPGKTCDVIKLKETS